MRSVIMATLNGEKYIKSQIDSILCQLNDTDELIISDSGSTDSTISIINNYNDKRIKVLFFDASKINSGEFTIINRIKASFLNGILHSKGDFIYLSDQDDLWEKNKVVECEKCMKSNNYDLIVHSCSIIDDKERTMLSNTYGVYSKPIISLYQSLIQSPFQGCCMVFTSKVRDYVLQYYKIIEKASISHDHAISFVGITKLGKNKIYILNNPLVKYRRHDCNVSSSAEKSKHSIQFKIKYRVNELKLFFKLYNS